MKAFGPMRPEGIIAHITKELDEIRADPTDLEEWADVIILGLDGAWRVGYEPQEIIDAVVAKQEKNTQRVWPDWRLFESHEAIEHDRSHD